MGEQIRDARVRRWMLLGVLVAAVAPLAAPFGAQGATRLDRSDTYGVVSASSANGTVAIGWWGDDNRMHLAIRRPSGAMDGPWRTRSSGGNPATIAVDDHGNALIGWLVNDDDSPQDSGGPGCCDRLVVASRRRSGGLSTPRRLTPRFHVDRVRSAITAGRALIAVGPATSDGGVWVARASAGSAPRRAVRVSGESAHTLLDMRTTRSGEARLAWTVGGHGGTGATGVQRARLALGARTAVPESAAASMLPTTAALASDGGALGLGAPAPSQPTQFVAATAAAGAAWRSAISLGPSHPEDPAVVALRGGRAVVAWLEAGTLHVVRLAAGRVVASRVYGLGEYADDPGLRAIEAGGRAVIALAAEDAVSAVIDPGNGALPGLRRIAPGTATAATTIAAAGKGRLAVTWEPQARGATGLHLETVRLR